MQLIHAAAIVDAAGRFAAPGSLLLDGNAILACGRPASIGPVPDARAVNLPQAIITPAFVNAHSHLDLTHLGPQRYRGNFSMWIDWIRSNRAQEPNAVADSVRRGVALSQAGGTGLIGDIAGGVGSCSTIPIRVLREAGQSGISFVEVFGLSSQGAAAAVGRMNLLLADSVCVTSGMRLGLQPHAPYSCAPAVYQHAAALGVPLSTHLAESPEELEFMRTGAGPIREFLARLGVIDERYAAARRHPIDLVLEACAGKPFLAAHVNYVDENHLARLRDANTSIAYCPRASAYFGHPLDGGPRHQNAAMIDLGINVALGTDSIVCLDTPDRISVLDEVRLLHERDGADPMMLLRMATTNGARALGFDESLTTLAPGESAGILAHEIDLRSVGEIRIRNASDAVRAIMQPKSTLRWITGAGSVVADQTMLRAGE